MDDYNNMMESEHSDLPYQTQITSINSVIENSDTANIMINETQTENDGQPSKDTNESTIQNEKLDAETNERDVGTTIECENASESTKIDEEHEEEEDEEKNQELDQSDKPDNDNSLSQLKVLKKEDDDIDMNQCRICTSSSNLLDIFRIGEKTSFRFCDLIMKLVPNVKISERDFLPHSICSVCVDRIEAAYLLRIQCEETDKMLRSKLKRSKKTTRRAPSEYMIIDAVAESSTDSDDTDQKSDDEFQISEESLESSESDSESSYDEKKKRTSNQRVWKRGPPKRPIQQPVIHQQQTKKSRNSGVVYINANDTNIEPAKVHIVKQPAKSTSLNRLPFRCGICNRPCSTAEALAQHRKTHTDEKCSICSMIFKQRSALLQHMQRHNDDPERVCQKCHRVFVTKAECQKHIHMAHPETVACKKCKRYFPNKDQLDAHKCATDRKPIETTTKRKPDIESSASGQDLFKSVAPLTTTYWSDSFSD